LDERPQLSTEPRRVSAYGLGLAAGLAVAVVYGLFAELLGLSWGLLAVGLFGGMGIGGAVSRGAWQGRAHVNVRRLQVIAGLIAVGAWMLGVVLAFVLSQALLPQTSTSLLERLSPARFTEYFLGLDESIRVVHAASLAAMALMAWRGAR
jgi:hypothetical protein